MTKSKWSWWSKRAFQTTAYRDWINLDILVLHIIGTKCTRSSSCFVFIYIIKRNIRSSHRRCSVGKGLLRIFAKITGKHLCQSLLFLFFFASACNFIKKESLVQVFSCKFCKISKSTFFIEHLRANASETYISDINFCNERN